MALSRAEDIAAFVADPLGHFSVGPTHVVWCHSRGLAGTVHWGRPGRAEAVALMRRLEFTRHAALDGGFDALMDASALASFGWPAFSAMSRYVRARLEGWNGRIRRQAIVVPSGLVGAYVTGLLPLLGPRYPLRFFNRLEAALAWLGRPELPAVLEEVAAIVDQARGLGVPLHALRDYLDRSLPRASLEEAARALGTSARTLQRDLRALGTGFQDELARARVSAVCIRLEHGDEKVDVIAREVGLSPSQLHALFRQRVGETPAEYRARHR